MKQIFPLLLVLFVAVGCTKDKLEFTEQVYEQKSTLPCQENCPTVTVKIPVAKNGKVVSDSINKRIFGVLRDIIYFGEEPYAATDYKQLLDSFIQSYDDMKTKFPKETIGWEAKVEGAVVYKSDSVINIKLTHYSYTGGAHGYSGERSLIFNAKTGKIIPNDQLFNDINGFKAFAEKKFREKYQIPENVSINATGLMFEEDVFALPGNIFYTDKGLLLYYNVYEVASYADREKELLLPYNEIEKYLKIK